jgi:hypothetical protein
MGLFPETQKIPIFGLFSSTPILNYNRQVGFSHLLFAWFLEGGTALGVLKG